MITSFILARSSLLSSCSILNLRYKDLCGSPLTKATIAPTGANPWIWELSNNSICKGVFIFNKEPNSSSIASLSSSSLADKKYPDLILADGGLIQVEAVTEALKEIEVDIPVFGLYKNDKHQTEGLIDVNGNTYPLDNKALFFLLTRMQDEVHRFAITFHRSKRDKKMKESSLDNIKGLGEKRKEEIRKAYPDINTLKNASIHELSQLLPEDVAEALYLKLHQ